MAKSICALLLILLLMALVASPGSAQERREITQKSLEWNVQNLDWIVQGQITSIQPRLMILSELFGGGSDENNMVVTEITMRVERAIAGEYDANELLFIIPEGELNGMVSGIAGEPPMQVRVGDSAIVGLLANTRGTSYNILDNRDAFYKIEGGELIPYEANSYFSIGNPLSVIESKARERELPEVFNSADLVCIGTVTDVIGVDTRYPKLVIKIGETMKGSSSEREITVDVASTSRSFEYNKPGYQVLLFLKKIGREYIPVAGVNGCYMLDGEKIIRGHKLHNLPLRMGVSQLKSKLSAWKEAQP